MCRTTLSDSPPLTEYNDEAYDPNRYLYHDHGEGSEPMYGEGEGYEEGEQQYQNVCLIFYIGGAWMVLIGYLAVCCRWTRMGSTIMGWIITPRPHSFVSPYVCLSIPVV